MFYKLNLQTIFNKEMIHTVDNKVINRFLEKL